MDAQGALKRGNTWAILDQLAVLLSNNLARSKNEKEALGRAARGVVRQLLLEKSEPHQLQLLLEELPEPPLTLFLSF